MRGNYLISLPTELTEEDVIKIIIKLKIITIIIPLYLFQSQWFDVVMSLVLLVPLQTCPLSVSAE